MLTNTWVTNPFLAEGNDRSGWKTLKTINSHKGLWLFNAQELKDDDPIGWIPTPENIPSPYQWGPSVSVWNWNGKKVITRETRHKYYEIIEVPSSEKIYKTDDEATNAFVAKKKAAGK